MRRNIAVYVHVPFLSKLFCYCCYRLVQTAVMVALLTKVDIMHVDFKQRFCYFYQVLTKFEFAWQILVIPQNIYFQANLSNESQVVPHRRMNGHVVSSSCFPQLSKRELTDKFLKNWGRNRPHMMFISIRVSPRCATYIGWRIRSFGTFCQFSF